METRIDRIEVAARVRKAASADVQGLARSIEAEGLINPVMLRQLPDGRVRLVAGLHRLEAFKLLGRGTIPNVWMPLSGDDALDDCTQDILECDENTDRAGLPEAVRMLFTSKRAAATARRASLRKVAQAKARMEEARAATKAAKARHEKAEAKAEADAARKEVARAEAACQALAPDSIANGIKSGADVPNLPRGVLDEVAKEMGLAKQTVNTDLVAVRYFGEDILTLASDIQLHEDGTGTKPAYTTRGELAALRKLKEEHKSAYEGVIASWRKAVETKGHGAQRPSLVLAKLAMREADLLKQESRTTVLGGLGRLQEEVAKASSALGDAYSTAKSLGSKITLKGTAGDIRAMREKLGLIQRLVNDLKAEHKVVGKN